VSAKPIKIAALAQLRYAHFPHNAGAAGKHVQKAEVKKDYLN
jgi:hypothetical protein